MMKKVLKAVFAMMIAAAVLCGCGGETFLDYGDAEAFEAALNRGEDLEGKTVQFTVLEYHPDSALGYDLWAGEHLNFVSSGNPKAKEGDTLAVRATEISNILGSWVIKYEKLGNAKIGPDTITSAAGTSAAKENSAVEEKAAAGETSSAAKDSSEAETGKTKPVEAYGITFDMSEYYEFTGTAKGPQDMYQSKYSDKDMVLIGIGGEKKEMFKGAPEKDLKEFKKGFVGAMGSVLSTTDAELPPGFEGMDATRYEVHSDEKNLKLTGYFIVDTVIGQYWNIMLAELDGNQYRYDADFERMIAGMRLGENAGAAAAGKAGN